MKLPITTDCGKDSSHLQTIQALTIVVFYTIEYKTPIEYCITLRNGIKMDDLILNYLYENFSAELADEMIKATDMLEQLDYSALQTDLLNIINEVELVGTNNTNDRIYNVIHAQQILALEEFGIRLDNQATFVFANDLLELLLTMEDIHDVEPLLNIINSANNPLEAFADLADEFTDYSAEDYLTYVIEVSPMLLARIKELFNNTFNNSTLEEQDELTAEDTALMNTKLALLKQYRTFIHDEGGILSELFRLGLPLLLPFEIYLSKIDEEYRGNVDHFYLRSLMQAAIACDSTNDPITVVHTNLEILSDEPLKAVEIDSAFKQHAQEFQTYLKGLNK